MTTTKGHLTQTEKRHIHAILKAGLMSGKVNRKTYHLQKKEDGTFVVSITENITNWCETSPKLTTNRHEFVL